jgi:hypothetical protein
MKEGTKFMIVVLGESEIGKTPAIRKTYTLIKRIFQQVYFHGGSRGDMQAVFKDTSGTHIGINSMGDPQCNLSGVLNKLVGYQCKVILTACRTASASANALNREPLETTLDVAKAHGYTIIWTLHYQLKDIDLSATDAEKAAHEKLCDSLNIKFAEDMIDLIQKLLV